MKRVFLGVFGREKKECVCSHDHGGKKLIKKKKTKRARLGGFLGTLWQFRKKSGTFFSSTRSGRVQKKSKKIL